MPPTFNLGRVVEGIPHFTDPGPPLHSSDFDYFTKELNPSYFIGFRNRSQDHYL